MKLKVVAVALLGLMLVVSGAQAIILPDSDLAKGKTYQFSTQQGDPHTANYAFDGNTETWWAATSAATNWIAVDFGSTYSLSNVDLYNQNASGCTFNLYYSTNDQAWLDALSDNTNWTLKSSGTLVNTQSPKTVTFTGENARYLKLEVGDAGDWPSVWEVSATAVPEPASALLFVLGGAAIAAGTYLRKKKV